MCLLSEAAVCQVTAKNRLRPTAVDFSVFASKHIEGYAMDFLHYLHGERELMFSTMANYLNALVVLAKWYDLVVVVRCHP